MKTRERYDQWHQAVHGAEDSGRLRLEQWHRDALAIAPPLKEKTVLEVGCGAGDFAIHLAGEAAEVTAVDFSPVAVSLAREKARRHHATVAFEVADAGDLPFADGSFSAVFSCECLEHVPSPPRALAEMHRVLRPGGSLVLTTENYSNAVVLRWLMCWARGAPFDSGSETQPIEHFFLFWRVRKMMRRAGFRVTEMAGAHHVFLLLPRFHPHTFVKERFTHPLLARWLRPFARHMTFLALKPPRD